MPPVPSPPPGRLPSSRDKVFLQLANVYLLAQTPPRQASSPKLHAPRSHVGHGSEVTKLPPCPTWSMSSNPRAKDADTLPRISCLILALGPAEPRTGAPSFTTRDDPGPFLCLPSHPGFLWSLERPKEGLIKDPEVGRKMAGFRGGRAIGCHLIATGLSPS